MASNELQPVRTPKKKTIQNKEDMTKNKCNFPLYNETTAKEGEESTQRHLNQKSDRSLKYLAPLNSFFMIVFGIFENNY